ncbi:hypothetical protein LTR95_000959 [Oleoguttula sp. CCFEE 5521]
MVSDSGKADTFIEDDTCINELSAQIRQLREEQSQQSKRIEDLARSLQECSKARNDRVIHLMKRAPHDNYVIACTVCGENPNTFDTGLLSLQPAPYSQHNAGRRLIGTDELLEVILLQLPSESILFAQRTERQFRSVIAKSRPLQHWLFLIASPFKTPFKRIILNPIITKKKILQHIPLYFDEKANVYVLLLAGRSAKDLL